MQPLQPYRILSPDCPKWFLLIITNASYWNHQLVYHYDARIELSAFRCTCFTCSPFPLDCEMRLLTLGKSKSGAQAKYIAINNTFEKPTLHLYRALLRQTGYLPDSSARTFFHEYVISRFRIYHPKRIVSAGTKVQRRISLVENRQATLFKTARRGLLFLQRANDGHPRHLGKILAMTYGRIGKRRHDLLQVLKVPDIPMDQGALEQMSHPASQGIPQPSRQLQALVKSQANRKLSFFSRTSRPTLKPDIPEKNIWGRPMPMRRVRNMKRRWYGQVLDRVLPPLPEEEWIRLRGLASGDIRWEGPIRQRGLDKRDGFNNGGFRGTLTGGQRFLSKPHQLTPRYMRRLWTKILAQCPLMKKTELAKSGWDIRWGDTKLSAELSFQPVEEGNLAMFAGVDTKGKVLPSF